MYAPSGDNDKEFAAPERTCERSYQLTALHAPQFHRMIPGTRPDVEPVDRIEVRNIIKKKKIWRKKKEV